ncbi:unnamed protein product [Orchesella dallaii]|uniref:Uncharacterized protein n=1 Tax=Orchesella dallaii TaxID=48710 RepID=A0ABP1RE44_9HEXA
MPPLCTRNTLFSPEVFWALPLLPDYSRDDFEEQATESPTEDGKDGDALDKSSRIPPWYIRGLWSQSLLGDLGGSIRLTLSRVPTLQMNKDYFAGGDYEQNPVPSSVSNNGNGGSISHSSNNNRTGSSKLLKRWHCRSRSTFRCLLLMSKELSKSIYLKRKDLSLIEAWIVDLKNIHYMEPPMLPRRRSHTNPCLGADGLHGVSFYPSLEPNQDLKSEEFIGKRNETFKELIVRINSEDELASQRDKRETERPTLIENSGGDEITGLLPPEENSTYTSGDWSTQTVDVSQDGHEESSYVTRPEDRTLSPYDTYYRRYKQESHPELATSQPTERSRIDYYHPDILPDQSGAYRRRGFPVVDKSTYLSDPRAAFLSASRSAKHLHEALAKHHEASVDGFPILKAMTETMCPGFGSLVPYQPAVVQSDVLLIIAFTNHHYDLIPTLEVLYRSTFPNMLYCGNPHESIDLFLRKYQSVEHRSFSFLPTYTRATYECVLGAMEMNYEVKGYVVITDETLIKTWNIEGLDKTKIWVSSSDHENRHVPVTKESWPKLDPRGQKLPRLLDGLANTWKMLTYFLVGQDSYILEPATIKKRSVDAVEAAPENDESENPTVLSSPTPATEPPKDENVSAEKLETLETSYVPLTGGLNRIAQLSNRENATEESELRQEFGGEERQPKSDHQHWDLTVAGDWGVSKAAPYARIPLVDLDEGQESSNETFSGIDETTDDVEVGEDDDDSTSSDVSDLMKDSLSETPSSSPNPNDEIVDEIEGEILVTPTSEAPVTENSTDAIGAGNISVSSDSGSEQVISTTPIPESSVGVPLYHVEHVEPPTPTTYHKPEEVLGAGLEKDVYNVSLVNSSLPEETSLEGKQFEIKGANTEEEKPLLLTKSSDYVPTTEKGFESESSTSTTTTASTTALPPSPGYGVGSEEVTITDSDHELRREMEILLDGLKKVYTNLVGTVQDYQEMNETDTRSHDILPEGKEILEDSKSHRISPREFRHIRCTMQDDGHQSELCSILRAYVNKLLLNLGTDIHLYHDTIPMYYLPSSATKPFYSVANVLLHHGVMDELALPLLFRGLAPESDWIKLVRSPSLDLSASDPATAGSGHTQSQFVAGEDISSQVLNSKSQYLHPFHLHKVYSDHDLRKQFCKHYLLRIFEM